MKLPVIRGVIDRRILINYRVDPRVLAPLMPNPFRPKTVHGVALVGICLIRLKNIRPKFFPTWLAISSENAAHRAAVEWDDNGTPREGVYVRRRDTSSWTNSLAGGRLFPGTHHHATFDVHETPQEFQIAVASDDGATRISIRAHHTDALPAGSIFQSLDEASAFFRAGSIGYSPTSDATRLQGLELRCLNWQVEPLQVEQVNSSIFDDPSLFPKGSIELDSALLMRGIDHEWQSKPDLCCPATVRSLPPRFSRWSAQPASDSFPTENGGSEAIFPLPRHRGPDVAEIAAGFVKRGSK